MFRTLTGSSPTMDATGQVKVEGEEKEEEGRIAYRLLFDPNLGRRQPFSAASLGRSFSEF